MKNLNILTLLALLALPLFINSCSENTDTIEEFPDWQARNDTYFQNIYNIALDNADGNWKVIKNYSYEDTIQLEPTKFIAVHVLEEGTGSGCPMYSDSVYVNYRGRLIPSTSYPDGFVFDENYTGDYNPATAYPAEFYVGDLVDGFTTALQYMHIGDIWRVYVPYQLGYGSADYGNVPAYSTLIFDIALIAYFRVNATPTPWKLKIEN
ncbi:MAG: FKBP-type peptidyl-prolyl cis-trans isomerase [Prevotella sp.]|nr:FKBP-type peptidyl-prolyl cis-trans isomerase [Prevotella sp.]